MKRKILLIVCMCCFYLVSCGRGTMEGMFDSDDELFSEGWDAVRDDMVIEEKKEWETREVEVPALPEITMGEVMIADIMPWQVGTTPYNFTEEELRNIVESHSIVTDNYDLYTGRDVLGYGETYKDVELLSYVNSIEIVGALKTESYVIPSSSHDFWIKIDQNTDDFTNWNRIYVAFKGIEFTQENQEKVFLLLVDLFGQEIAEYLVYQNISTDYRGEFYDDNIEYILYSSRDRDRVSYSLEIDVMATREDDRDYYYDGGYEPLTDTTRYTNSQLSGGIIEDIDVSHFRDYAKDFMNIGAGEHMYNDISSMSYRESELNETENEYRFSIEWDNVKEEWDKRKCPTHKITWKIVETTDEIVELNYEYVFENNNTSQSTFEEVVDTIKEQIKYLIPDANLNTVTYDTLKSQEKVSVELPAVNVLGLQCDCIVVVKDDGKWTLTISYEKE